MVNKPRHRKQKGHGRTYLTLGIIAILVAATVSYAYVAGLGPFNKQSTSTTTTTTSSLLYAEVNTGLGSFEVELFNSLAPKTVANFVNLVKEGFYNGLMWHRIQPGFVIQTGDPFTRNGNASYPRKDWGTHSSGVPIPVFENSSSLPEDEYYMAMASTGSYVPGTSQFFINLANNTSKLDGRYAVFGKVINGTGVVQALGSVTVEEVAGQDEPVTPVYVNSITMINGT